MFTEKKLIQHFHLANWADIGITFAGIHQFEAQELNPLGFTEQTVIAKMAVVIFLTALYALSKTNDSKYAQSVETSLQIGTALVYSVVLWNTLNVAVEMMV